MAVVRRWDRLLQPDRSVHDDWPRSVAFLVAAAAVAADRPDHADGAAAAAAADAVRAVPEADHVADRVAAYGHHAAAAVPVAADAAGDARRRRASAVDRRPTVAPTEDRPVGHRQRQWAAAAMVVLVVPMADPVPGHPAAPDVVVAAARCRPCRPAAAAAAADPHYLLLHHRYNFP